MPQEQARRHQGDGERAKMGLGHAGYSWKIYIVSFASLVCGKCGSRSCRMVELIVAIVALLSAGIFLAHVLDDYQANRSVSASREADLDQLKN
jgi:hypothetical protein